eukprot:5772545-Prymnesium_polylepis.1
MAVHGCASTELRRVCPGQGAALAPRAMPATQPPPRREGRCSEFARLVDRVCARKIGVECEMVGGVEHLVVLHDPRALFGLHLRRSRRLRVTVQCPAGARSADDGNVHKSCEN